MFQLSQKLMNFAHPIYNCCSIRSTSLSRKTVVTIKVKPAKNIVSWYIYYIQDAILA